MVARAGSAGFWSGCVCPLRLSMSGARAVRAWLGITGMTLVLKRHARNRNDRVSHFVVFLGNMLPEIMTPWRSSGHAAWPGKACGRERGAGELDRDAGRGRPGTASGCTASRCPDRTRRGGHRPDDARPVSQAARHRAAAWRDFAGPETRDTRNDSGWHKMPGTTVRGARCQERQRVARDT
jgi:hypothetical protein